VRLIVSAVEAPKLPKFRQVNGSERSPVTDLQHTAYVFRSNYAFHLIAKGLTMCHFFGGLFCTTYRFAVTRHYPIFEISKTLRTRLPDAFRHLVPNDHFHYQTPLKNANCDLFGSENASRQI